MQTYSWPFVHRTPPHTHHHHHHTPTPSPTPIPLCTSSNYMRRDLPFWRYCEWRVLGSFPLKIRHKSTSISVTHVRSTASLRLDTHRSL